MVQRWRLFALVLGGTALGCSAQVDSDYLGGDMSGGDMPLTDTPGEGDYSEEEDLPEGAAVAIIWELYDPAGYADGVRFGEIVSTTGSVPDAFQLDITEPPRPEFLIEMADGNALAVARIQWVSVQGFVPEPGGGWSGYGSVSDYALVYVRDDVALDSPTASFLHSVPLSGYHMMLVDQPEPIACGGSYVPDERGFIRYTGTCPRNQLLPTINDMQTTLSMGFDTPEILYEDLETAW